MEARSFILSSAGLKNVVKDKDEFTFIFGDHKISMNAIFAEFISPIVSHLHISDPTISSFQFNCNINSELNEKFGSSSKLGELFTEDIIELFKNLSSGIPISINEDQCTKLRIISIFLCNEELFQQLSKFHPFEINLSNIDRCLSEIQFMENISNPSNETKILSTTLLDFISSNFYLIDQKKLRELSFSVLFLIIQNKKLKIESEDSLFNFIKELFNDKKDNNFTIIDFLEMIEVKKLSNEKFSEFIQIINFNEITGNLWMNICSRFCSNETSNDDPSERYYFIPGKSYLYDGNKSHSFEGIINQITKEVGGNVNDKGAVIVTASSQSNTSDYPKHAVDLHNKVSYFITNNVENSWIKYDFKNKKVRPTHYSIMSEPYDKGNSHLKNWVIEGSNNNDDWNVLDSKSGITDLDNKSVFKTFKINKELKCNEYYRYLRLRITGPSASGKNILSLAALEYFGSITESNI